MNPILSTILPSALVAGVLSLTGCTSMQITHVPPGESLKVALAQKAELVRLPAEVAASGPLSHIPAVEPALPENSIVERVAEAYTRGEFCLSTGNDAEAITAFEEVVKIDPAFTEGWQHLAMLYEKQGDAKKAMEAFRRSKKIAAH